MGVLRTQKCGVACLANLTCHSVFHVIFQDHVTLSIDMCIHCNVSSIPEKLFMLLAS